MRLRTVITPLVCLLTTAPAVLCQQRLDLRSLYERCYAIVPIIGAGTPGDPRRPKYAPPPAAIVSNVRTGTIGFTFQESDNGQFALVEYVATDRKAFAEILADPSITTFVRGQVPLATILAEFLKYKKNFDFNQFGVRMP